jgi:hypothetical protein
MLDQGGAAFHPVAIIGVPDPLDLGQFRLVDMAADDPIKSSVPGFAHGGGFEPGDVGGGLADVLL